jgi:hypothetical protein
MAKGLIASLFLLLATSMPASAKGHSHSHSRSHNPKSKSTGHVSKGCSTQRQRPADPCAKQNKNP